MRAHMGADSLLDCPLIQMLTSPGKKPSVTPRAHPVPYTTISHLPNHFGTAAKSLDSPSFSMTTIEPTSGTTVAFCFPNKTGQGS